MFHTFSFEDEQSLSQQIETVRDSLDKGLQFQYLAQRQEYFRSVDSLEELTQRKANFSLVFHPDRLAKSVSPAATYLLSEKKVPVIVDKRVYESATNARQAFASEIKQYAEFDLQAFGGLPAQMIGALSIHPSHGVGDRKEFKNFLATLARTYNSQAWLTSGTVSKPLYSIIFP